MERDQEELRRVNKSQSDKIDQLVGALKKQRNQDDKQLQDHYNHLQTQIKTLQSENQLLRKHTPRSGSPIMKPDSSHLESSIHAHFGLRSRSPNQGKAAKDSLYEELG